MIKKEALPAGVHELVDAMRLADVDQEAYLKRLREIAENENFDFQVRMDAAQRAEGVAARLRTTFLVLIDRPASKEWDDYPLETKSRTEAEDYAKKYRTYSWNKGKALRIRIATVTQMEEIQA